MAFLSSIKDFADSLIFLLIGLLIGVHYGLDGWAGRQEVGNFKDSPRVRNFRWVLGAGLFAFFADLKVLGIQGNKTYDVLAYISGFLVAGVLTVCLTAFFLFFRSRSLQKRYPVNHSHDNYPPVSDYIVHGYRHYAKKLEEAIEKKNTAQLDEQAVFREGFLPTYAEQMSYSMVAVQSAIGTQTRDGLGTIIVLVLQIIKGIVLQYHHKDKPQINVNVMIAYSKKNLPQSLKAKTKFSYSNHDSYSHYLAIEAYADHEGKEDFVLPVENIATKAASAKCSLPGAPLAFLNSTREIIDDTRKIQYPKSLPAQIKKAQIEYFKTKAFKSFGCVVITGPNAVQLGVLVVESNKKCVFGKTEQSKTEMAKLLEPFALLIGNLIIAYQRQG